MRDIKQGLYVFCQAILWLAFCLALADPALTGTREAGSMYATYGFLIDPLYMICNVLTTPLQGLFGMFGWYNPALPSPNFPVMHTADGLKTVLPMVGVSDVTWVATAFPGAIVWWNPLASLVLSALSTTFDRSYEPIRNHVWNVVIEYMFQRKKARLYERELDTSKAELAKLSSKYTVLAQETTTLKDSVITDELTKLYNKRFFLNRIQVEFDVCKGQRAPLSIIMIDIDFFKRLNDTYGHIAGDEVLKAVSSVIKRFSPEMCYPCRYGGEEFSLIMPNKTPDEAMEAAQEIQEHVQQLRFDGIDKQLRVSVSQGICAVDFAFSQAQEIRKFDQVLELADQQLYKSKIDGRNRVSIQAMVGPQFN